MTTKFPNFPSPHSHLQSLDTGSTLEEFIKREKELETGTITCTDHGYLGACRDVYSLAKEHKLRPIIGIEGYHRDDGCLILQNHGFKPNTKGTYSDIYKYGHITLHAQDQAAFEKLIKVTSDRDLTAEPHGSERKPIYTWTDLAEIGSYNVTMTSGCLIGIVGRHVMDGRMGVAVDYYEKLRSLAKPGNFYVELFTHKCDKNWVNGVFITLEDGSKYKFYSGKKVKTTKHDEVRVDELSKFIGKGKKGIKLIAIKNRNTWSELPSQLEIVSCEMVHDFIANECTPACPDGDLQLTLNKFLQEMAAKHGDKVLISDDAHYAYQAEKIIQEAKLAGMGDGFRFYGDYHRFSSEEAFKHFSETMGMSQYEFESMLHNNLEWASKFDNFKLENTISLPTKFYPTNTIAHLNSLIQKHGRMDWNNPAMVARLKSETDLLYKNGKVDLLPYFFLGEEVVDLYEKNGQLTGAGRGSAAGMLIAYLLSITHVNPLDHGLSQDRFMTLDRVQTGKMPDIDQDLPDRKILLPWLKERFGDHFSQVSTNTLLRLKSSILDVARAHWGHVPDEIVSFSKALPNPPVGVEDVDFIFGYKGDDEKEVRGLIHDHKPLRDYIAKYPEQWAIVQKLLGIVRAKSRHASAYIIANKPIDSFIPLMTVTDTRVTQYTAASCEASGALKMDYLCLNTLKDLSQAIKLIQERSGLKFDKDLIIDGERVPPIRQIPHHGKIYNVWKLPEDQDVFRTICEGSTETVFQLNTSSAKKWLHEFNHWKDEEKGKKSINSIEGIAAFTALDRPGPLDAKVVSSNGKTRNMLEEFAARARGERYYDSIDFMNEKLPETNGVMVYQEQLQNIFQELTGCTGIEANNFRNDISKKHLPEVKERYPIFMEKAPLKVRSGEAQKIWDQTVTFGQYGFNKSVDGNTILCSGEGYKKIRDFRRGDRIQGVDNFGNKIWTKVINLHNHGILDGWEITFDDGYTITTSLNHKFLTTNGQVELYNIIDKNLEVLSGKTDQKYLDNKMQSTSAESSNTERSSKILQGMLGFKENQYTDKTVKTQYKTRATIRKLDRCACYFCQKRHPTSTGSTITCMAESQSRKNTRNLGISKEGSEEIKGGSLVKIESDSSLARRSDSMWEGEKTSGLCESRPHDMGRSGRILPLFFAKECKKSIKAIYSSKKRCHAESRGHASSGCDIDPAFWRMLSKFRWKDENRTLTMAYSDAPLTSTGDLVSRRIVRIRSVGKRRMYDIEVSHSKHNFLLPNGVITSNSHAVCYAATAYVCSYFKHHFPLEWWCAVLRNAVDKDKNEVSEEFWKYCNELVRLPDISYSESKFIIKDGKIIAPLNLLQGVGTGAHEELSSNGPYKDIYDFCNKIAATKLKKSRVDPETGKVRAGNSALNRGVVSKLIVSGVMDSLFPAGLNVISKLEMFEAGIATALKKKRPEKIKEEYRDLSAIQIYQHKKAILPIYSEDLTPYLFNQQTEGITKKTVKIEGEDIERYAYKPVKLDTIAYLCKAMQVPAITSSLAFVDGPFLKYLNEDVIIEPDAPIHIAVAAYVVDVRKFTYRDKKTNKIHPALEMILDVNGEVIKSVKWPSKKEKELIIPEGDLVGSICICLMSRWNQIHGFSIDAILKCNNPLGEHNGTEAD